MLQNGWLIIPEILDAECMKDHSYIIAIVQFDHLILLQTLFINSNSDKSIIDSWGSYSNSPTKVFGGPMMMKLLHPEVTFPSLLGDKKDGLIKLFLG